MNLQSYIISLSSCSQLLRKPKALCDLHQPSAHIQAFFFIRLSQSLSRHSVNFPKFSSLTTGVSKLPSFAILATVQRELAYRAPSMDCQYSLVYNPRPILMALHDPAQA